MTKKAAGSAGTTEDGFETLRVSHAAAWEWRRLSEAWPDNPLAVPENSVRRRVLNYDDTAKADDMAATTGSTPADTAKPDGAPPAAAPRDDMKRTLEDAMSDTSWREVKPSRPVFAETTAKPDGDADANDAAKPDGDSDAPPSYEGDTAKPDQTVLAYRVPLDFAGELREFAHRHGTKGPATLRRLLDAALAAEGEQDDAASGGKAEPSDEGNVDGMPTEAEPLTSLSLKVRKSVKAEWDEMLYLTKRKGPALLRAAMTALKEKEGWPSKK